MRPYKRVVGVTATIAGLLTLLLMVGVPAASAATMRFVGSFVGFNTGCNSPGFTSVQDAVVAAAPGDTVYLCGTTPFAEQVIINKSLTLTGDPGATIAAPSPTWVPSSEPLPPEFVNHNLFQPQAI